MGSKTHINITYWNVQGIHNKKNELKIYMKERSVDVMLLGETFLKPYASLKIPNYITYRTDRKAKQGGGTAVLVKKT